MTLAGELVGAFLAGIAFTIIMLALFAGRLSRWATRRMMRGMMTSAISSANPDAVDVKVTLPK